MGRISGTASTMSQAVATASGTEVKVEIGPGDKEGRGIWVVNSWMCVEM